MENSLVVLHLYQNVLKLFSVMYSKDVFANSTSCEWDFIIIPYWRNVYTCCYYINVF
jgi:hypothetical protein